MLEYSTLVIVPWLEWLDRPCCLAAAYVRYACREWKSEEVEVCTEFIQSDVPSNTFLLIPNEFGTAFERLERLEELEIQYSQPERETI